MGAMESMRRLNVSWCLVLGALSCAARPPVGPTAATSRSTGESPSGALPGYAAEVPSALLPRAEPLAMRDAERIPVGASPVRGRADALVTMVVFSDFQCPFCARVGPTLAALSERYGDDIRFVWKNNPLPFHDRARPAAEAAMVVYAKAGAEAFWRFHDALFEDRGRLSDEGLEAAAEQVGVTREVLRHELATGVYRAAVEADMALAQRLGAAGTPGFFINGTQLVGAQPVERFVAVIDPVLALARAITPRESAYAVMVANPVPGPEEPRPSAPPRRPLVPDPTQVLRVPASGAPSRGPSTALVTMVVFSDFQCPFCSRVNPTVAAMRARYGNDLRVVFRHQPLAFHTDARPAAEAAMEAFAQRGNAGFWRMHDLLFANQRALGRADLERYARTVGLDLGRFRSALDQHTHEAAIAADAAMATGLDAAGTPHFFINGQRLSGAQPEAAFAERIEAARTAALAYLAAHPGLTRARYYDALMATADTAVRRVTHPSDDPDHVYTVAANPEAPAFGAVQARVVIEHFTDFQCPYCARVAPTIAQIRERYGDRVRFRWRHYPLAFHQHAMLAAEAAQEAFAQQGNDGFDRYRDALFANQQHLEPADLERYARDQGLDLARFRDALDRHAHQATIRRDMAAANATGARIGTPAFFIGGRFVAGALPFAEFERRIDAALAAP